MPDSAAQLNSMLGLSRLLVWFVEGQAQIAYNPRREEPSSASPFCRADGMSDLTRRAAVIMKTASQFEMQGRE
jgi:hypothetical protein